MIVHDKNFKQLWQHKITSTQNCLIAFFFQCELITFQKWFLTNVSKLAITTLLANTDW
jgi:hypothetical protein